MWKGKFGKSLVSPQKGANKQDRTAKIYVGEATAPPTPQPAEAKPVGIQDRQSRELQDWQLDSTFDSKNLTSTRDLDGFMASLSVSSSCILCRLQRLLRENKLYICLEFILKAALSGCNATYFQQSHSGTYMSCSSHLEVSTHGVQPFLLV